VNAVSVVSTWITDAVSGLWTTVSGAFGSLWKSVSGALGGLWTNIVGAFAFLGNSISSSLSGLSKWISGAVGNLWTSISSAFSQVQAALTSTVTYVWSSLSGAIGAVGNTLGGAITSLGASVSGALGSLWTNTVSFFSSVADGINNGINAIGGAVGSAVNTIGSWVSDLLAGMADALGKALSGFVDWLWKGLQAAGAAIVGAASEYIVKPLLGALNWIRDTIYGILQSLWSSIQGVFGGHSPVTPEEASWFTVPLLLVGAGAGFGVSVMGAVASVKALGTGIEARAISDFMGSALALGDISRSVIMPIFNAAYEQPIRFYYNSIFRPAIPDTRAADQMLFEEHIGEAEWRQIYRYHGWKEQHIDAWYQTMWREPSLLILRAMAADPDVDEAWVRKKMREGGLIGEDQDAIIDYGIRQSLRDERSALATQIQTDLIDEVIIEADARADLAALKFSPAEVDYRIEKAIMMKARNIRRAIAKDEATVKQAAAKAAIAAEQEVKKAEAEAKRAAEIAEREAESARAKAEALAKKGIKKLTESDYDRELELGLTTPTKYIADMTSLGYSVELANRKYALQVTPKPVSAEELERRRRLAQARISRTQRRYDFVIARHDLQTGFLADTIEYLSSLEKPPATRIATLQAQLAKAADEKALILEERDAEISELEAELKLVQAG